MAEREGFEPPIPVKVCLISSQVHSTGLCHLSESNYRMLHWMVEATKWGSFDSRFGPGFPAIRPPCLRSWEILFRDSDRLRGGKIPACDSKALTTGPEPRRPWNGTLVLSLGCHAVLK